MPSSVTSNSSLRLPEVRYPQVVEDFLRRRPSHGDISYQNPTHPGSGTKADPSPNFDLVKALGPGGSADNLGYLVGSYASIVQSFSGLLQMPFLNAMINDAKVDTVSPDSNLRDLVVACLAEFNTYMNTDLNTSRDVISYGSVVKLILPGSTVQNFVKTVGPIVQGYADSASKKNQNQTNVLGNLNTFTLKLQKTLSDATAALDNLGSQIKLAKQSLADVSIISKLTDILGKVFEITSKSLEERAEVQLSSLLEVSIETLDGDFEALFEEAERSQRLIASLLKLKNSLSHVVALLKTLTANLPKAIEASQGVTGVWVYVNKQFKLYADSTAKPSGNQIDQINAAWGKAISNAAALQNCIAGVKCEPSSVMSVGPNAITGVAYPKTSGQIEMMSLASKAGIKPATLTRKLQIARSRLVGGRVREKYARRLAALAAKLGDDDEQIANDLKRALE
ncbi:hypothetical protein ABW19_dt0209270 [Dactylella cylindrospora]|nr:hypothetical protein ABW19_dt0209270 [Dactylella cylindrospora]